MLNDLQAQLANLDGAAPVHLWDPPFCGPIPLTIDASGQWWYDGSLIKRQALINLFARVLKREGDEYFLVTPAEKVQITVEDVPLLVTSWDRLDPSSDLITVHTSTDDHIPLCETHQLQMRHNDTFQCAIPYVNIRHDLWARIEQHVYYQLAEQLVIKDQRAWLVSGEYQADFGPI